MRWFAGVFIAVFFLCSLYLAFLEVRLFQIIVLAEILIMGCAYLGYLSGEQEGVSPIFYYPYYFAVTNIAALVGLFQSFRGSVQVIWEPHRLANNQKTATFTEKLVIHGAAAALFICLLLVIQKLLGIELSLS